MPIHKEYLVNVFPCQIHIPPKDKLKIYVEPQVSIFLTDSINSIQTIGNDF